MILVVDQQKSFPKIWMALTSTLSSKVLRMKMNPIGKTCFTTTGQEVAMPSGMCFLMKAYCTFPFRIGNFKVITNSPLWPPPNSSYYHMYDVTNDPGERHNLKHKLRTKFNEVHEKLVEFSKSIPPLQGRIAEKTIFKRGIRNKALAHGWCAARQ